MRFDYYITTDIHGYKILWRADDSGRHAHLRNMQSVHTLLTLLGKNLLPKDEYLQGSARRLLNDDEYKRLKRPKDKYYNTSGHNKR